MIRFLSPYFKKTIHNKMIAIIVFLSIVIILIISRLLFNGYLAEVATKKTLTEYQPRLELAVNIKVSLKEAYANLGFYVISKDENYLNKYQRYMQHTLNNLNELANKNVNDKSLAVISEHIKEDIVIVSSYVDEIIRLQTAIIENVPGFKIANTQLEPMGQEVAGIIQTATQEALNQNEISDHQLEMISNLSFTWTRMRAEIRAFLSFRSQQTEDLLRLQLKAFKNTILEIERIDGLDIVIEDSLVSIKDILPAFDSKLNEVLEIHKSKLWRKDILLMEKEINPKLMDLDIDINNLIDLYKLKTNVASKEVLSLLAENFRNGIIDVVIIILFGILMFIFLIRTVLAPLKLALGTMQKISDHGDLEHTLPEDGVDEYSDMGKAFNKFLNKIRGVVDLVINASINLVSESDKLTDLTNKSEQRAVQQEQEIREVSDTFQQLNDSMQIVQSNTAEAANAANAAHQHSEHGQKVVDETIDSMGALAEQVDITHARIEQLYEMSNNIGEIVKVISGITDQTNLLALNAAIEAARAGEQGRGFAVVADEVRSLAQGVQKETETIHAQINSLQKSVSETLQSMEQSKGQAKNSVEMAGRAGEALREIYTSVNIITDMSISIAEETNGQGKQSQMVLDRLQSISDIAEESAGTARDVSATGKEFRILSQQLEGMVQQFLLSKQELHNPQAEEEIELF